MVLPSYIRWDLGQERNVDITVSSFYVSGVEIFPSPLLAAESLLACLGFSLRPALY